MGKFKVLSVFGPISAGGGKYAKYACSVKCAGAIFVAFRPEKLVKQDIP